MEGSGRMQSSELINLICEHKNPYVLNIYMHVQSGLSKVQDLRLYRVVLSLDISDTTPTSINTCKYQIEIITE